MQTESRCSAFWPGHPASGACLPLQSALPHGETDHRGRPDWQDRRHEFRKDIPLAWTQEIIRKIEPVPGDGVPYRILRNPGHHRQPHLRHPGQTGRHPDRQRHFSVKKTRRVVHGSSLRRRKPDLSDTTMPTWSGPSDNSTSANAPPRPGTKTPRRPGGSQSDGRSAAPATGWQQREPSPVLAQSVKNAGSCHHGGKPAQTKQHVQT